MKKLLEITQRLSRPEKKKLKAYRHPHRRINGFFDHKVGLKRHLETEEVIWLNDNTTDLYSVDKIGTRRNVSFKVASDALMFKLAFSEGLTCKAHEAD